MPGPANSRTGRAVIFAAGIVAAGIVPVRAEGPASTAAVMQGLDKVTARVSTFDAPIGKPVRFGTLEITVFTCVKRPPEEPPESSAFVQIDDQRPDRPKERVFSGWMFASSPAVNPLEHAIYDVWVLDCK